MRESVRLTLLLGALVGGVVSVGAEAADPATPAPAPAQGAEPIAPVVTVTSAGEEPRVERRYTPGLGSEFRFDLVVRNTQRIETPDNSIPENALPPISFVSKSTVTSTEGGVIAADLVFETIEVGVDPIRGPVLTGLLKPLEGKGGAMKISDRGDDLGFSISGDAQSLGPGGGMMNAVASTLRGVIVTVPVEPIGPGAQWTTIEHQRDDQGVDVTQTITHTLESVNGSDYVIALTFTQHADPQDLKPPPNAPGGVTWRLTGLEGTGSATVTGSFTSLMPTTVTMSLKSTTELFLKNADTEQTLKRTTESVAEGRIIPVTGE